MRVYMYVSAPEAINITSDVMWSDIDPVWLVKQVLQLLYGSCSQCY